MALGDRLTRNNRLSASLMRDEAAAGPIRSHTQGMASLLRNLLAGRADRADIADQEAAMQAMNRGVTAQGWVNPDDPQGGVVSPGGGIEGMIASQQGLGDNPYAQRNLQGLLMQKMQQENSAKAAAASRQAAKEDYLYQQQNKAFKPQSPAAPRTVKTAEGVYILNPDGTKGARLGGAKAETVINMGGDLQKGYRPTDKGAEYIPGGSKDPAVIQESKEAERLAALNVENLKKLPGRRSQIFAATQNAPAFKSAISDAIKAAQSPFSSGLAQQVLGGVAVGPAFELERALDTIKSNIGFGELIRIKEAGGTLGALSEMENRLLQAMQGALDPRLSKEKMVAALQRVEKIQEMNLEQKKREFKEMYPKEDMPWNNAVSAVDTLPPGVTEDDISETMRENNMTREEVLRALRGQ